MSKSLYEELTDASHPDPVRPPEDPARDFKVSHTQQFRLQKLCQEATLYTLFSITPDPSTIKRIREVTVGIDGFIPAGLVAVVSLVEVKTGRILHQYQWELPRDSNKRALSHRLGVTISTPHEYRIEFKPVDMSALDGRELRSLLTFED